MENTTENMNKSDLINGEDFDSAIEQAANLKKEVLTTIKSRNKDNYNGFYDLMVMTNHEIESILSTKKKDRKDAENEALKKFKKETSLAYKTISDLLVPEILEDGEQSKFEKMVYKLCIVAKLLRYIGNHEIDNILKRYGYELKFDGLEKQEAFVNDNIRNDIIQYLESGRNIKKETNDKNEEITDVIYSSAVPTDLQFDKSTNPTGIKVSDFTKLVDIKTNLMMAADDDAKDKVTEKANDLAGDKQYEIARAKLVQEKIINLIPGDETDNKENE